MLRRKKPASGGATNDRDSENGRIKRGDFEQLVRQHLDEVLLPRGFALTPQPPADVEDPEPFAAYESTPEEFVRRFPGFSFGQGMIGHDSCVDIWIKQDRKTGRLFCELEGHPLTALLGDADLSDLVAMIESTSTIGSAVEQLDALALGIAAALDANRA